jgi:hypothetical protein
VAAQEIDGAVKGVVVGLGVAEFHNRWIISRAWNSRRRWRRMAS